MSYEVRLATRRRSSQPKWFMRRICFALVFVGAARVSNKALAAPPFFRIALKAAATLEKLRLLLLSGRAAGA